MIPVILDPARLRLALLGRGARAAGRLRQLREGGAGAIAVFSDIPSRELAEAAGSALVGRLPRTADLPGIDVAWVVDLPRPEADRLHHLLRGSGALVNVEDVPELCDFHSPALVRRGDLMLTVSTGGRSPRLAARLRAHLEQRFDAGWAGLTDRLGRLRQTARAEGEEPAEIARRTDAVIDREGWLT